MNSLVIVIIPQLQLQYLILMDHRVVSEIERRVCRYGLFYLFNFLSNNSNKYTTFNWYYLDLQIEYKQLLLQCYARLIVVLQLSPTLVFKWWIVCAFTLGIGWREEVDQSTYGMGSDDESIILRLFFHINSSPAAAKKWTALNFEDASFYASLEETLTPRRSRCWLAWMEGRWNVAAKGEEGNISTDTRWIRIRGDCV